MKHEVENLNKKNKLDCYNLTIEGETLSLQQDKELYSFYKELKKDGMSSKKILKTYPNMKKFVEMANDDDDDDDK